MIEDISGVNVLGFLASMVTRLLAISHSRQSRGINFVRRLHNAAENEFQAVTTRYTLVASGSNRAGGNNSDELEDFGHRAFGMRIL